MALGQVYTLRKNLSKVPGHLDAYHNIIQDQLKQKFIEKVSDAVAGANTHYIPHHGVLKDSDTTPLRILYNCSARDRKDNPSLNDCLIKGPSLTVKLGDVLLKFRVNDFAFCADISKAFLRVGLQNVDRDFVRFLWFRDPQNPEAGLDTYRFASVLFGSTSSPFLLMATLDYHLRRTVIWSDNEAAIQWVRNDNCKITYVKNREAEIREASANYQIFHISTGENPAYLVTRGVEVKDLVSNSLWFKGPSWLPCESLWPSQNDEVVVYEITAERQIDPIEVECLFEVRECSSLEKIFMITKYVFQFLTKLLLKISPNRVSKITLPDPAVYWLRYYQLTKFKETFSWLLYFLNPDPIEFESLYDLLQKPHSLSVECSDLIKDLGLYFDPSIGLMRSRGRLQHAEVAVNSKYPVLVPPGEHLTNLFILKAHRYNLHGGVQETLATIRQQLWIPKGRQAVRKVIRKCVLCRKVEGKPCVYPGPPSLPLHRVVLNRPFENVGVDYSGPIVITKTEDNEPGRFASACLLVQLQEQFT
ncbi:uncharacterized protein LOC135209373 [Macrobrachium nipponense]|uniref:uncharacterized protein LOC135209373 n=1 Tax=Macrobrachium nipponense TaxID=159736 RepID=UPI0030C802C8